MESWRKYLTEAKLQKVDWMNSRTWPAGADEVRTRAFDLWKKWKEENRRLRKQFFAAIKAEAKTAVGLAQPGKEMSSEEFERIADEHADHILKPLGGTMVAMLNVFHEAGLVPPPEVVKGANSWRSGELEKKKRLEARALAEKAAEAAHREALNKLKLNP